MAVASARWELRERWEGGPPRGAMHHVLPLRWSTEGRHRSARPVEHLVHRRAKLLAKNVGHERTRRTIRAADDARPAGAGVRIDAVAADLLG